MHGTWYILPLNLARWLFSALLVALLLPSSVGTVTARSVGPRGGTSQETQARAGYNSLPLAFETNQGQAIPAARFLARSKGYALSLAPDAVTLNLPAPLRLTFPGANPNPVMRAEQPLPGIVNSFLGNDPSHWRTNIPTAAKVRYTDLYPGLDLVVYGTAGGAWEYDVVVAPGADPAAFTLSVTGATGMTLDATTDDLVLATPAGEVRQHAPRIYQEIGGERRSVAGGYALRDDGTVGFAVGAYDPALPLVVDPTLVYSTYLGGSGADFGAAIAVDARGNAYIAGYTRSTNFPVTNGSTLGSFQAAFVTKLDGNGSRIYSTYLGGNGGDGASGIAVDATGNAYVTGQTTSTNFPVTGGSTYGGAPSDAFVTKFDGNGMLIYSVYLGGNSGDGASGIAVDAVGNTYVTGNTNSTNLPATDGSTYSGSGDAFVTKLDGGGAPVYSVYLGGSGSDTGSGIAVDTGGRASVTGYTRSTNFPVTNGSTFGGVNDAFVTRLDGSGGRLYSMYLGGSGNDTGNGVAVDTSGNTYVTGTTGSTNFPVTTGPPYGGGSFDTFVTRLDGNGTRVYSTYLGGTSSDTGGGIAVDTGGDAYVTGTTNSPNFPVSDGSTGGIFVTELNGSGGQAYGARFGGNSADYGVAIAVGGNGHAYVTGYTYSTNFPVTTGSPYGGGGFADAFVTQIVVSPPPIPNPLPPPQPGPAPSGQPAPLPRPQSSTVPASGAPNPLPGRRP